VAVCFLSNLVIMAAEYDIIIIGGGPAGLSAAASIVRQDHETILFDSSSYRNSEAKHMHTVPSWDHRDPAEFRAVSLAEFKRYGSVTVQNTKIEIVGQNKDSTFTVKGGGKTWTGKKLLLATGVEDIFPDIPGYAECWVSGM
jgi:gliotoxin/aspirochlorine biosynthesis thioredoxin reductase